MTTEANPSIEKLQVTEQNIAEGKKKCGYSCPVARALRPHFVNRPIELESVHIKFTKFREIKTDIPLWYDHGPKLQRWIRIFDDYDRFHNPFKIKVDHNDKTIEICE